MPAEEGGWFRLGRLTRTSVPSHEIEFICKIGRIEREEALSLLHKHMGNREAVFSDLAWRKKPQSQS